MCKSNVLFVFFCLTFLIYHKCPLVLFNVTVNERPRGIGPSKTTFYALLNYFYALNYKFTQIDSIARLLQIA